MAVWPTTFPGHFVPWVCVCVCVVSHHLPGRHTVFVVGPLASACPCVCPSCTVWWSSTVLRGTFAAPLSINLQVLQVDGQVWG